MNTFFLGIYIVPRDSDSNWYPIPYQRALIYHRILPIWNIADTGNRRS